MRGIAGRIALASILVAGCAVAIIAVGVFVVGGASFERMMVEHGESVAGAREMFDETVTRVFVVAAVAAAAASAALAVMVARRISRPLRQVGRAARRIADGDYAARAPREGPEELVSLADSFNQMAAAIEEQERLRREFIANAAHELRTPLTNLQGYLEALRDGVVPPARETFVSLHEEVERLVRLARSLDALADGDPASGPPTLVECDLVPTIGSAVELAAPAFERRAISLEVKLPSSLRVRADADHLTQVLANLLQNAVRYTPDGGRATIAAAQRPDDVLVSVTNSGDGIPAADLPHVFERFYRVEKSRDHARAVRASASRS